MVEKKFIEKLITQHKKSTLINHWKDAFFYNTTKYSGEIKADELLLWRSSAHLRGAYPIFHLSFHQNGVLKKIEIKKNPYHKLLDYLTVGCIIVLFILLLCTVEFKTAILGIIGIFVLGTLLHLVLSEAKKYETKNLTYELKEAIENIGREQNIKISNKQKVELNNEKLHQWSLRKVITRLLIYPFCLFILWISITFFLPEGKIGHAVFGIIVALGYPIADILILIGKNKSYL